MNVKFELFTTTSLGVR